jgi:calcium binding protein 39
MNLLRHRSSQITFEAFHVFKIFVVNPKKTMEVAIILYNNRAKLISFLEQFHNDKTDAQFLEEKQLLIE